MMPPALGALRRSSRLGTAPWSPRHSHRTPAQSREERAAPSFTQGEGSLTANKPQTHPDHDTASTHPEIRGLGSADKAQHTRSGPGTPVGKHSPAWAAPAAPARGGPARRWPLAHPRSRSAHGSCRAQKLRLAAAGAGAWRCCQVRHGNPPLPGTSRGMSLGQDPARAAASVRIQKRGDKGR